MLSKINNIAENGMCTDVTVEPVDDLRGEMISGMLYSHTRANANTTKLLEVTSFSYALIELLQEKGLITIEELDARKTLVAQRLAEKFRQAGMGAVLQEPEQDKYTYQNTARIDCENRIALCKAACCKLAFALSRQDIEEGIVKWKLGQPYLNAQASDGYCVHLQRGTHTCGVYQHRPLPCRAYDCRKDKRIWQDFEKAMINPGLDRALAAAGNGRNGAPAKRSAEASARKKTEDST